MSPSAARPVVSGEYGDPIRLSLIQQIPVAILFLLIMDDGTAARIGAIAMIGYWIAAALMWLRRPHAPSRFDLLFLRWGFFPLLAWAGAAFVLFHQGA